MLLYADDLVLLVPNLEALTAALDTLEEVAAEWGLTINHDKTEVMIIQPPTRQPQEQHPSLPQGQQGPHKSSNATLSRNDSNSNNNSNNPVISGLPAAAVSRS